MDSCDFFSNSCETKNKNGQGYSCIFFKVDDNYWLKHYGLSRLTLKYSLRLAQICLFSLTTALQIILLDNRHSTIIATISTQTFIKLVSQRTLFSKETIPLLSRKQKTQKCNKVNTQLFLLHASIRLKNLKQILVQKIGNQL